MLKKIRMYKLAFKYWMEGDEWEVAKYVAEKTVYWSNGKGI